MRRVDLLIGLGLVALLVGVSYTAPRWSRWLRQPVNAPPEEGVAADATPEPKATDAPVDVKRTINVKLFFEDPASSGLVVEERSIAYHANLSQQLRIVAEELVRGSMEGRAAPLAGNGRVQDVFVTARGVAYIDLSKEVLEKQLSGTDAELMAVYSLVNSVALNFPAVKRVQILIDGRMAETLAGHVDLSRPLTPDMTLMASFRVPPQARAAATPAS
jgi:spore germination protein GerM